MNLRVVEVIVKKVKRLDKRGGKGYKIKGSYGAGLRMNRRGEGRGGGGELHQ